MYRWPFSAPVNTRPSQTVGAMKYIPPSRIWDQTRFRSRSKQYTIPLEWETYIAPES